MTRLRTHQSRRASATTAQRNQVPFESWHQKLGGSVELSEIAPEGCPPADASRFWSSRMYVVANK